jgi:predicted protein tyrosine phosphatase
MKQQLRIQGKRLICMSILEVFEFLHLIAMLEINALPALS